MSAPAVSPFLLEVVKNALDTIADELALIVMRTAYSSIVRDAMDYSTAVCDADGNTLAQGLTTPLHLGSFFDAMWNLIRTQNGRIAEGDLFIFNDPYLAAGQHLPDIYVVRPIFVDGAIEGWATTVAHQNDVGGIVPGSNSIGSVDIFQEGLRLPILKLHDAGRENTAIWDILAANVRVPEKVIGDVKAQVAACLTGERAFQASARTAPPSPSTSPSPSPAHPSPSTGPAPRRRSRPASTPPSPSPRPRSTPPCARS